MTVRVSDIIEVLDEAYPRRLAESWDSVGLVCGDPDDEVASVAVCVDVTDAVVDWAIDRGAGMIVAHHPLLLRGVDSVAADTTKGRVIHRLIRSGVALFTAHTNADRARPGVSDALADALGIIDTRPLQPKPSSPMDKWAVTVPEGNAEQVSEAMFAAGGGHIGDYRDCSWSVVGTGQFEATDGANPTLGEIGERTRVDEAKVEMVAARHHRQAMLDALRRAHPYEEPAFDVFELAELDSDLGLGRVGTLEHPMTLAAFAELAAQRLGTPWGVRAAGDPDAIIATVAVCGGAGDSLLAAASRSGADAYLTGDLRHHPVDEARRAGGPALIDAGHWGTEFPWCAQVSALIASAVDVDATVYDRPTDPFTILARNVGGPRDRRMP